MSAAAPERLEFVHGPLDGDQGEDFGDVVRMPMGGTTPYDALKPDASGMGMQLHTYRRVPRKVAGVTVGHFYRYDGVETR